MEIKMNKKIVEMQFVFLICMVRVIAESEVLEE
jgi:hypothetical protein